MSSAETSTAKRQLKKLSRIPTPAIFAVCLVVATLVLWWQGSLGQLWDVLKRADLSHMLIAAPIYVASLWLLAVRWHELVRMAQGWSDLPKAAEAFLTSVVINYAAPVGLAVPSRAALTKRALGMDRHATGVVAIWEIGMDVIVLSIGTLIWLVLAQGSTEAVATELFENSYRYANFFYLGLFLLLILLVVLFRKAEQRRRAVHFIGNILKSPLHRPAYAIRAFVVSALYWIIQGIVLAFLVRAMGVEISFVFILGLTTLPMLVGMLSPIPGGAVVREAMMYVVARLAGVPGTEVVAAAVLYRMALFGAIPILYGLTRLWLARRGEGHPNLPQTESV